MNIHIIWAQDINGGIGKNNSLPWHISEDLINFKKITLNKPIIMGRKTWDSLKFKPLPKRRNIVLSSQQKIKDAEVFKSKNELLNELLISGEKEVFVIGGAQIYKEFWDLATSLHITIIKENYVEADTFFPIEYSEFEKDFKLDNALELTDKAQYQHLVRI